MASSAPSASTLRIEISADRLSAFICAEPSDLKRNWDATELPRICARASLPVTPAMIKLFEGMLLLRQRPPRTDRFEIATGTPPTPASPARAICYLRSGELVTMGKVIGVLEAPAAGVDGTDVSGQPIPTPRHDDTPLKLGPNTSQRDGKLLADTSGYLAVHEGVVSVESTEVYPGDIDSGMGSFESEHCLSIRGSVKHNAQVKSSKSIYISGTIESATVSAAHDLTVEGGIILQGVGRVIAGRSIRAKYAEESSLVCPRDIEIQTEVLNSTLIAGEQLLASSATIVGGEIHAVGGVEAGTIGNAAHTKTLICVGTDPRFQRAFDELMPTIQADQKRCDQIRKMIAPLLKQQKSLVSDQKEKLTELLYEADTLEQQTRRQLEKLRHLYETLRLNARPEIYVRGTIFPGTTLRFPGVEAPVRTVLTGPLRIEVEAVPGSRRIVAVFGETNTAHPIESRPIAGDAVHQMQKRLAA